VPRIVRTRASVKLQAQTFADGTPFVRVSSDDFREFVWCTGDQIAVLRELGLVTSSRRYRKDAYPSSAAQRFIATLNTTAQSSAE
jgi:hypothetical protein